MKTLRLGFGLFLAATAAALGQTTPAPAAPRGMPTGEAERAAMAKLDYMAGRWEGGGWTEMGGSRHTFHGSETVQKKLRGVALLVEGDFKGKLGSTDEEGPVHTTLGVISFDSRSGKYRFDTWLATGSAGKHELALTADGWQWELQTPQARLRFTARFTPAGEWTEIGERSTDGTSWQQFFEMKLTKKS